MIKVTLIIRPSVLFIKPPQHYDGQTWKQICTNLPKNAHYAFKRKDGLFMFHSPGKLNLYDPERCLLLESQPLVSETLSSSAQACQLASSNQLNQLLTLVNTKYDIFL
jgi:hypothetical protein